MIASLLTILNKNKLRLFGTEFEEILNCDC